MKSATICVLVCICAVVYAADTVYVNPQGLDTAACGVVNSPCRSLAFALGKVKQNGGFLKLAPGNYQSTGQNQLTVPSGVSITLQPDGLSQGSININCGNKWFVAQHGSGSELTLQGLLITHCEGEFGSAVNVTNGRVIIDNCTINYNLAKSQGGAVYVSHSKVDIRDSVFNGNHANQGGCVYAHETELFVHNSVFLFNLAQDHGALHVHGGRVTLVNSIVNSNQAHHDCGGLLCEEAHCIVDSCVFAENVGGYGGAMYVTGNSARAEITNTMYKHNAGQGGVLFGYGGSTVFTNTTVDGHVVGEVIYCRGSAKVRFVQSLVYNNTIPIFQSHESSGIEVVDLSSRMNTGHLITTRGGGFVHVSGGSDF